ncbi:MAG: hypothetical protein EP329_08850 [Deltaproteobacteria bacterium]|nr:MAG: hypothetical protein EP329_08850 [Deltaproteobacteria bacterium]
MPHRYLHHDGLFAQSYLDRVVRETSFPRLRVLPADAPERLAKLVALWEGIRGSYLRDARIDGAGPRRAWTGLLPHQDLVRGRSESDIENAFIRPVCEQVLGYSVIQNRHLALRGIAAQEVKTAAQRPDLVLFTDPTVLAGVVQRFGADAAERVADGLDFCRSAALIIDAKRFDKGVGADELVPDLPPPKRQRTEPTAIEDVQQVERYLRGYDRPWGVLTNGRCWRLMQRGRLHEHLRFDLVRFLEDLRGRAANAADFEVFNLFWHLFGPPAVGGGYLDAIAAGSAADTRKVRDVLRDQAHEAVEAIARGFWSCRTNETSGLTVAPALPPQAELDHLRDVSLTLLYRLLFVLKAEAQGLLPMWDTLGADTPYARKRSTLAIFKRLGELPADDKERFSDVYDDLLRLFDAIDRGDPAFDIPAYNGGLFDRDKHPDLARWKLLDGALDHVLGHLIYLEGRLDSAVPYADLDVRDLGDIYEGLLEQRLVARATEPPSLSLTNQKGERKASGSYFTPDVLVERLVRRAVEPLLFPCGDDPTQVLALRVLDPAMGSGHFLVKVVDVMADYLTVRCDPEDPDAPRDNGPAERAYWKRRVVESCIYGVDYNPMAVELARVALWLYTAEPGKPLSFLDHHLKVGNSLVGTTLDRLASPGLRAKSTRAGLQWSPVPQAPPVDADTSDVPAAAPRTRRSKRQAAAALQISLPFPIDTSLFSGILASIRAILARPSESARDIKQKGQDYARAVGERLAAHRLLADLWCLQWFLGDATPDDVAAYEAPAGLYAEVKRICGLTADAERAAALDRLSTHPLVVRVRGGRDAGYGPRPESWFHWQLEFPEVAFDAAGRPRTGFGFHAVIGNPPWDRIRPERRHFYGPYGRPDLGPDWDVANRQGPSLESLIARLHGEHPGLADGWAHYEAGVTRLAGFLRDTGVYRHQVAQIDGKKTGGDPDTFRYFVERALQACAAGGRVGLVTPSTLWQAEGCTGLRRFLLGAQAVEELFVFENYRKWAFAIDSRFKFTTFVVRCEAPTRDHWFPAAFMLRDTRALEGLMPERVVRMSGEIAARLSPGTLALLDLSSAGDAALIDRLHAEYPALGSPESGWAARYRCELHMTNDAWLFKTREWMRERGFLGVRPERRADGTWAQVREGGSPTARYPDPLPPGGEHWVAADAAWYRERGYLARTVDLRGEPVTVFVHPDDARHGPVRGRTAEERFRILPGALYTALYEGRMVHQLDHAQKAYESGEGRRAVWSELDLAEKRLRSRVFVAADEAGGAEVARLGFCEITGATNERTMLASLLPNAALAGNKVPTLRTSSPGASLALAAVLDSFVWDYLVRQRVTTTLNWAYVARVPVPQWDRGGAWEGALFRQVARLSCTTPELADVWNAVFRDEPWSYASAERDPWRRAELRAELDAIVADAYGLSVPEYARVLASFPLLDRSQPPLPGDFFVTDCDDPPRDRRSDAHEETPWGWVERKPRSFITRDLALLTYMRRKGWPPPQRLDRFFAEDVGLDPVGPLSRFRIGAHRDLVDRVHLAKGLGAVAYVPTGRGGAAGGEVEAGDEDE